jgi:threonylcarbamoyladenosine tRNA methylthiotransferase MtaB
MATFHLLNFGCRASQADGAAIQKELREAGLEEVPSVDQTGVAILNTCTVTANADAEVRQVIRRIHRVNPACQIVVTGCYAQRAPQEIAQIEGVAWVIGNSHKHQLAALLKTNLGEAARPSHSTLHLAKAPDHALVGNPGLVQIQAKGLSDQPAGGFAFSRVASPAGVSSARILVGKIPDIFHFAPVFPDDRTRPTLKIQDGCNARCSFCIIPTVRGPSRSLAPDMVIRQVSELEEAGCKEIVLSGINLGSYGKDLGRQVNFLSLIERILAETSIPRIRISSMEPMDVSAELIQLVAREARLARHFHVPLQSGCDRILRLMNRRYWAAQYAERILAIRAQVSDCGIGADVMAGFPGETDQDHASSARFIESLPFTYLHVFPYSARPNTPAAQKSDQLDGCVIRERSQEIRSLIARKRQAFLETQLGRTLSVLTLDQAQWEARVALSSNYLKVVLPHSNLAANTLLNVIGGRVHDGLLHAYPAGEPVAQNGSAYRRFVP